MNAYPNPPKEELCDSLPCSKCGTPDSDLVQCIGNKCNALIHRACGDRCEACGWVVCPDCVDHWMEYPYCPGCLLVEKSVDERAMELEEECTLP